MEPHYWSVVLSFSSISYTGALSCISLTRVSQEKLHISLAEHFVNKEPFEHKRAISIFNVCSNNFALLHITDLCLKHCLTSDVFLPHAISLANFLLDGDATYPTWIATGGDDICEPLANKTLFGGGIKDEVVIGPFRWSCWDVAGISEDLRGVFSANLALSSCKKKVLSHRSDKINMLQDLLPAH